MPFDANEILENIDVGVMVVTASGTIQFANRMAPTTFGLTVDDFIGKSVTTLCADAVGTDGRPLSESEHPCSHACRTLLPVADFVMGVAPPNSTERIWLRINVRPKLNAQGGLDSLFCSFTNISDAKRQQQSTEDIYHAVIRAMSEGVVIHEQDSSIRLANPAAERILGMTTAQMTGRTPLDPRWKLSRPDGTPPAPEDIPSEITRKTGNACKDKVLVVHRPTGERAWLSVNSAPFDGGGAAGYGTVATFTDITAEHEARIALEESRAHFQRVLDALPGVVYQFVRHDNGENRLEFVSRAAIDLLGISATALQNASSLLLERIHPDDLADLSAAYSEATKTLHICERDFRMRNHQNDGWMWIRARAIPERTPNGIRWTGVAMDTTQSHLLADGLQRAQRREAMGDLAAGIAHNFNNLLAAIVPNLEMAHDEASEALRPMLADAQNAARNAAELVAQLLAFGKQENTPDAGATADLVAVVNDAIKICRRTFDRGIRIETSIAASEAFVRGRASELQQIILNLVLNARDAVENRVSPRISISLAVKPGPTKPGQLENEHIELAVQDNGAGMDEATLRRIGEPFFTTKEPGRGTGLGLATVFQSVTAAHGTLHVESKHLEGTSFSLRFPLIHRLPTAIQSPAHIDAKFSGRIVLIDDEELVRRVLGRVVVRMNLEPIEISNGDEAGERIEQLLALDPPVRAVILDLSMPGLSGAEILKRIRKLRPTLPVIILSGHIVAHDDLKDASRILQKPVSASELKAVLAEVLGG
jgi:two-component system, cell cycle sensor histidine kinase and response regulator CckA